MPFVYVLIHDAGEYEDREVRIRGVFGSKTAADQSIVSIREDGAASLHGHTPWCCSVVPYELHRAPAYEVLSGRGQPIKGSDAKPDRTKDNWALYS